MNNSRRKQIAAIDTAAIRTKIEELQGLLESAHDEFDAVKVDEEEARENLPESLQEGEQGEKMQQIIDGLESLVEGIEAGVDALREVADALDEFENNVEL